MLQNYSINGHCVSHLCSALILLLVMLRFKQDAILPANNMGQLHFFLFTTGFPAQSKISVNPVFIQSVWTAIREKSEKKKKRCSEMKDYDLKIKG